VHRPVQTVHLGADLVGRLGPGEWLRIGVVLGDVALIAACRSTIERKLSARRCGRSVSAGSAPPRSAAPNAGRFLCSRPSRDQSSGSLRRPGSAQVGAATRCTVAAPSGALRGPCAWHRDDRPGRSGLSLRRRRRPLETFADAMNPDGEAHHPQFRCLPCRRARSDQRSPGHSARRSAPTARRSSPRERPARSRAEVRNPLL
jgi:hypothetical protein